jgi:hypothetical protein
VSRLKLSVPTVSTYIGCDDQLIALGLELQQVCEFDIKSTCLDVGSPVSPIHIGQELILTCIYVECNHMWSTSMFQHCH